MPENLPALSRSTLDTSRGFLCLQTRKTPAERGFETIWMTMELMIRTVVYSIGTHHEPKALRKQLI